MLRFKIFAEARDPRETIYHLEKLANHPNTGKGEREAALNRASVLRNKHGIHKAGEVKHPLAKPTTSHDEYYAWHAGYQHGQAGGPESWNPHDKNGADKNLHAKWRQGWAHAKWHAENF